MRTIIKYIKILKTLRRVGLKTMCHYMDILDEADINTPSQLEGRLDSLDSMIHMVMMLIGDEGVRK